MSKFRNLLKGFFGGSLSFNNGKTINVGSAALNVCLCLPDTIAVATEDHSIKIYHIRSGDLIRTINLGESHHVSRVMAAPDGSRLIIGFLAGFIRIIDFESEEMIIQLEHSAGESTAPTEIFSIATHPSGSSFVACSRGSDGLMKIWDLYSYSCTFSVHLSNPSNAAISPNGSFIAVGDDSKIVSIYDYDTTAVVSQLEGHNAPITCVAFSADGEKVSSSCADHEIRLWRRTEGTCVITLSGVNSLIYDLCWTPVEDMLVSTSRDGRVQVWRFENLNAENGDDDDISASSSSSLPSSSSISSDGQENEPTPPTPAPSASYRGKPKDVKSKVVKTFKTTKGHLNGVAVLSQCTLAYFSQNEIKIVDFSLK